VSELLQSAIGAAASQSTKEILVRLAFALVSGFLVSWIYRLTRVKEETTDSFQATLVMLAVLIAMVTGVIGDSVARAFSLVGALSIVRFRTVVRDTQDTAFVLFSVVVGMAAGAGAFRSAVAGVAFGGIAAALTMRRSKPEIAAPAAGTPAPPEFLLTVVLTLGTDIESLKPVCEAHAENIELRLFGTTKQGSALRAMYGLRIRPGGSAAELVKRLNQTNGVQSVELERPGMIDD
jgi:type III secretory pathway component EscS